MPLRPEMRLRGTAIAIRLTIALMIVSGLPTTIAPGSSAIALAQVQASGDRPDDVEIVRAIDAVKADPNLATDRTIKTLRWKGPTETQRPGMPGWMTWILGLFRWIGESARVLMWCVVVALVGFAVVFLVRLVGRVSGRQKDAAFVAPTHVFDLDIRPETLPQDIGAAARALWDRGEHRAALALLYRGLLSRLVHVHHVPIRDSSTEADCLALARASQLAVERRHYVAELVRIWQRAVYGSEDIDSPAVYALCSEFAVALDPVAASNSGGQREVRGEVE